MAAAKVVILHALRREGGGTRRLSTWVELFTALGAETRVIPVLSDNRHQAALSLSAIFEAASGRASLESSLWSRSKVIRQLSVARPDLVVFVTLRAVSPRVIRSLRMMGTRRVVIDLVDPLSTSYAQRARIVGGTTGFAYGLLSKAAARSERFEHADHLSTVVAGWGDAQALRRRWLPILTEGSRNASSGVEVHCRPWHAIFVGSLDYAPNVEAVERLSRSIWPTVRRSNPEAVLAIAGRRPARRVLNAVTSPGIEFVGPFDNIETLLSKAQVSVSPLTTSTGFQIKVLDAAQFGLPQVVSSVALRGFAPGFPARIVDDDDGFAKAVVELLDNPDAMKVLASEAYGHLERYRVEWWLDEARDLLGPSLAADRL